jgi:hypothetical protein
MGLDRFCVFHMDGTLKMVARAEIKRIKFKKRSKIDSKLHKFRSQDLVQS